jgi:hypothetical protein
MNPLLILVTTAALGVEVGWQPLAEGGHEYTIQIEPQLLGILQRGGEEITSEVPPGLDVRRYRITVGTGKLARDAGEPTPAAAPAAEPAPPEPAPAAPAEPTPGDPYGTRPGDEPPPPEPAESNSAAPTFPDNDPFDTSAPPSEPPANAQPGASLPNATADPRAQAPAKLPDGDASEPIRPANYDARDPDKAAQAQPETTNRPELQGEAAAKPWTALLVSVALLCCSLGANFFLGWNLWDARSRYRDAVAKFRTAGT